MSTEQELALQALERLIETKEFQTKVRKNIERENAELKEIKKSLSPSPEQYDLAYNL